MSARSNALSGVSQASGGGGVTDGAATATVCGRATAPPALDGPEARTSADCKKSKGKRTGIQQNGWGSAGNDTYHTNSDKVVTGWWSRSQNGEQLVAHGVEIGKRAHIVEPLAKRVQRGGGGTKADETNSTWQMDAEIGHELRGKHTRVEVQERASEAVGVTDDRTRHIPVGSNPLKAEH